MSAMSASEKCMRIHFVAQGKRPIDDERTGSAGKCLLEPRDRESADLLEGPRFFEQVGGSGHQDHLVLGRQPFAGPFVERDDLTVAGPHDQQGRRSHLAQRVLGEVGATAARHASARQRAFVTDPSVATSGGPGSWNQRTAPPNNPAWSIV